MRGPLLLLALIASLTACSQGLRPDLARLYDFMPAARQPPVIVIPGILGSRLRVKTSGNEIWPGSLWDLLVSRREEVALRIDPATLEPLDDGVEAYALFETALGSDFYGEILRTLERAGRYERGVPGAKSDPARRRYYVFPYDWRQDNVVTARKLDALIEQIRRDYADPQLKVDIVAHSMGGLVTRYYLRYGTADVLGGNEFPVTLAGADKVRTAVLLGTPNLGSVNSLHAFLVGTRVGLRTIAPEIMATLPSVYQLFPHPVSVSLVGLDGRELQRDLFDVEIWQRFQWSLFDPAIAARIEHMDARTVQPNGPEVLRRYFDKRLERARRFVWSLSVPEPESALRLVVFGGDCTLTPARLLIEDIDGDSRVRLYPDDIERPRAGVDYARLMLEPGDGEVTKPSLLARDNLDPAAPRHRYLNFPLAYSFFLCEAHQKLTGNLSFQDNLLNVLLSGDRK